MTYRIHKIISGFISLLILFCFVFPFTTGDVLSSEEVKEDANFVMPADQTRTGDMNSYSKNSIVVNNVRFRLCPNTLVFNFKGKEISFTDIDAAEKVKLFENKGCVRKIIVLSFAH